MVHEVIVNNESFVIRLEEMFRHNMKRVESAELLACATEVVATLGVEPYAGPIEGYYPETPELSAYFQLMRALQGVDISRQPEVADLPAYQRLEAVAKSPLFGEVPPGGTTLLCGGRDPLSYALLRSDEWSVPALMAAAGEAVQASDDFSLVGLAVLTGDPAIVTATRETAVLYAEMIAASCAPGEEPTYEYVWRVDDELTRRGQRFVETANTLLGSSIPMPGPEHAASYTEGSVADCLFRCVRIGQHPERGNYHWALRPGPDGTVSVDAFWSPALWTTEMYREKRGQRN